MEIYALDALVLVVVIPHPQRRPDVTSKTYRHGMRDADLCHTADYHRDAAKDSGLLGYGVVSVLCVRVCVCVVLDVSGTIQTTQRHTPKDLNPQMQTRK